jgi:CubicO group peptidase (beta-lactamase class C family)
MKRLHTGLLVIVISVFGIAVADDTKQEQSISEQVDALFAEWDTLESPGAAVAVVKDGMVVHRAGYGSAQLEYGIPITPSTVFHVASVSKQFTAFSAVLLAQGGKISLDDEIQKHIPEVPDFGKKITVSHLIHHVSGIRDQWELLAMAGWRLDDVITLDHIMKLVKGQKELNFDPGSQYLYCNTGYTLLAEIVARISSTSFREWTGKHIFLPLGMSNTHFHDNHEHIVPNRAYSYSKTKDGFEKSVLSYANVGATSLFTTVEDMANWMKNYQNPVVGDKAAIEQMLKQGVLNDGKEISYAHGVIIGEHRGLKTVSHSGGDAGFRSHMLMFPDQDFGVVVLSNLGQFNPSRLAYQIAELYLTEQMDPEEEKAKVEYEEIEVDPAIFDDYVGAFLNKQNAILWIKKEDDKLWGEIRGFRFQLHPASELKYFINEFDATITFVWEEDDTVNSIVINTGEEDDTAERLDIPEYSVDELKEFAGEYYSDELKTAYELRVQENSLIAVHQRHSDIPLTVIGEDWFQGDRWYFGSVKVERDDDGAITGFQLTGSRVRNMLFEKR